MQIKKNAQPIAEVLKSVSKPGASQPQGPTKPGAPTSGPGKLGTDGSSLIAGKGDLSAGAAALQGLEAPPWETTIADANGEPDNRDEQNHRGRSRASGAGEWEP